MEENQVTDNALDNPIIEPEKEKMISQSQVDKIIKHKTYQAAQVQRDLEERHQKELEAIKAQQHQQTQRNENVPRDVDANAIYQQVQEKFNAEMQQRQFKDEIENAAKNYISKIEHGKGAYEDFSEITKDFEPADFPQVIYLLSGIDNAADIIYDLSKRNPEKFAELQLLAERSPRLAQARLLKLSRSISENKQAAADERSNSVAEPLDRLQSSRVSGSNGKMGIRDLRNQSWLRG